MARIEIIYTTKNTNDISEIDEAIASVVSEHGGTEEGSGYGPEGRELVFEVFPNTELRRLIPALNKNAERWKSRGVIEGLTLQELS